MDVSIIFVNYKSEQLTCNAIESVLEKTEGLKYEIFVVDNNSQDGSIEAIEKKFPNINIIKNPINAGFGAANNLAIKQAKGKYIFCLNTDTLLVNNAIKLMFDFMEKEENQNVGVCGGLLHDVDLNVIHSGGRFPCLEGVFWKFGLRYLFPKYYRKRYGLDCLATEIEYVTGADIMFRKSVLDKVGLFDENYFMYFEESDLCYRIKKIGYLIKLINDAKIIHLEGKSTKDELKKKKWFKSSEFYYFKKHHSHKFHFVKLMYLFLYFIDGYVINKQTGKDMFKFVFSKKTSCFYVDTHLSVLFLLLTNILILLCYRL